MFRPRILSKNHFTIAGLRVEVCSNEWSAPPAYQVLVDAAWKTLLAHTAQPLWDGTYYRVLAELDLDREMIRLGTIRYRYIATFPALHQYHTDHRLDPLLHLSTIALIRTNDRYYLFGRRTRNGEIDLIGGGVQRDELEIATGADLERNLLKEIHEEVGIGGDNLERLTGIGILLSGTSNVLIIGHANADLNRSEAVARFAERSEEEMSEPVFVAENDLCSALRSMNDYRPLIPELI